jgi:hypothetical protein
VEVKAFRVVVGLLALVAAGPGAHAAARRPRPLFEPTDLELEDAGTVEADVQVGMIQGRGPARAVIPDLELDLGLFRNLELDVDAAYAIEGPETGPFAFEHGAPDSLWAAAKVGLLSFDAGPAGPGLAVGLQVGPKLPVAPGSHGVGGEALALVGLRLARLHAVVNTGAFADPAPAADQERPRGLEAGLDLSLDLDAGGRFSATGELSAVWFASSDPRQMLATGGVAWQATAHLELALVGLVGLVEGSDRYGVLLGVSPRWRLPF